MSDMPAPRPSPTPSAHEQHDPLLIAQLVAGDPIDDAPRLDAQRLVATCRACATLAADLAAVSRAVAWEPIPPRRRDFRLDAERAAELRGSRLQRLLRRLSLPQSGALRPLAAGVMSVGLLFVVAGTVWPQGSPVSPAAPLASPEPMLQMELPAPEGPAATAAAPADAALEQLADGETGAGGTAPTGAQESPGEDAYALDAASQAEEAVEYAREAEPGAADDAAERAKALNADPRASSAAEGLATEGLAAEGLAAEPQRTAEPQRSAEPQPTAEPQPIAGEARDMLAAEAGTDIEDVLLVVGVILAAAGAILLLVIWLGRRVTDPLLR